MSTKTGYDLIVVGAGSAGLGMALFAAKIKLRVLLIERSDAQIGGECLNDDCVSSKALIHLAEIVYKAKCSADFGYNLSGKFDLKKRPGLYPLKTENHPKTGKCSLPEKSGYGHNRFAFKNLSLSGFIPGNQQLL